MNVDKNSARNTHPRILSISIVDVAGGDVDAVGVVGVVDAVGVVGVVGIIGVNEVVAAV